jgi:release factor glutamine methyltransferase
VTDAASGYRPTLDEAGIERIRRWHEQAYEDAREEQSQTRTFGYLGTTIRVPPGVMPVTSMSYVLGDAVIAEVRDDDVVLDMGTGSGVNAILAARKGARVVAVDVSTVALDAARSNAERNGVADLVEIRRSDLFDAVHEAFDLIVFDPPYRWFRPRDALEAAMTDENYAALTRFFREARDHLAPNGRMFVAFATSGDLGYLRTLIAAAGFREDVVGRAEAERDGERVEYFAFRLR